MIREKKEERRKHQQRLQRNKGIDKVSLVVFTCALVATVYVAVGYLKAQQQVRALEGQITSLQKEVISIKNENGAIADSAEQVDLEYVKNIAINQLGMVHPADNQVIDYDSARKDYVKQYADIPDGESSEILDSLKKK